MVQPTPSMRAKLIKWIQRKKRGLSVTKNQALSLRQERTPKVTESQPPAVLLVRIPIVIDG